MVVGGGVGQACDAVGLTLPVYIGAMLVGAVIRNFDDRTRWVGLSVQTTDLIGNGCLAQFLAVALMNLKLWELSGLALPLIVNLGLQVALVVLFCVPVFRHMGRDYYPAGMSGGCIS